MYNCNTSLSNMMGTRSFSLPVFFQFIFSTALDGKIKAWLYDNLGSRVDYDAPGRWCTTMAYSADGTRYAIRQMILCNCFSMITLRFCSYFSFSLMDWVVSFAGYFLVVPAKMGSPTLLNGMKVKELLRGHTKAFENDLWVLCSLIQPRIGIWQLVMIFPSNFGIWTMSNFSLVLMLMEVSL